MLRTTRCAVIALAFCVTLSPPPANAERPVRSVQDAPEKEPVRNIDEWDLKKNKPAIDGYDPVAYFPEGGGKPAKGSKDNEFTHKGVTYRFANTKNLDAFKAKPSKYEPAHGGWCSYAMLEGDKTEPDPKTFIVKDGRLYLFYNGFFGNTKKEWEIADHATQVKQADEQWKKISGEEPRKPEMAEAP